MDYEATYEVEITTWSNGSQRTIGKFRNPTQSERSFYAPTNPPFKMFQTEDGSKSATFFSEAEILQHLAALRQRPMSKKTTQQKDMP